MTQWPVLRKTPPKILGRLAIDRDGLLTGWTYDPEQLTRKLVVELLADGESAFVLKADCYCEELRAQGIGDGCYGFVADLEGLDAKLLELTLANDATLLASIEPSTSTREALARRISPGEAMWRGGLRITGWIATRDNSPAAQNGPDFYEGSERLDVVTRLNPGPSDLEVAATQFDALLPLSLADGKVHQVRVLSPSGAEVTGSPVTIFATPGSYSEWIRSSVRQETWDELKQYQAELLDRLIPQSVPFEAYPQWKQTYGLKTEGAMKAQTRPHHIGVMVLGTLARDTTTRTIESQVGDLRISVAVIDPVDGQPGLYPADKIWGGLTALRKLEAEIVLIVRAGATLLPAACLTIAEAMAEERDGVTPALGIADHELMLPNGGIVPFFGPAFDYERLWSQGYAEGLFALRPTLLTEAAFKGAISSYDILFAAVEAARSAARPNVHIPLVLGTVPQLDVATAENHLAAAVVAHALRTRQPIEKIEKGRGNLFANIRVKRPVPDGHVAIIIPTRDRLDLLRPCLDTLRTTKDPNSYSIHIIDNGSQEPETADYLAVCRKAGMHIHRDDRPFNYAQMHNSVVPFLDADFLCLLNNDVEILEPIWLDEMKRHFSREGTAAVGAKLMWPNGMLQHGGVVLGSGFAASHAYDRCLADEPGYCDGVLSVRECSAVTAACLLTTKSTFLDAGGFNEEAFPVAFNDVDFCLKIRTEDKRIIWTPAARLLHRESASRLNDRESSAKISRATKEINTLRARWGSALVHDPYYNPNLNQDQYAFTGLDCSSIQSKIARISRAL